MNTYPIYYLDILKDDVLKAACYHHMTAADCKVLSLLITEKTRQRISETTLKRIYGFALSRFKPSAFTIDVLAKYCGYESWTDFCEKHDPLNSNIADTEVNWHAIQQKANKITSFTITALKNRSGIPYSQTIKRTFIDQHFDEYLQSGCVGTVFSAPAGYGKTIALCRWVEEKMALNILTGNKDIILFFSSNALMSVLLSGRDLNDWMLALLGYSSEGDLNTLLDNTQRGNGNFYLIVDGFDEYKFKNERFNITLSQLVDILALHMGNKFLKVILTMRPATWTNYRHELESIDNIWYTGFKKNSAMYVNVPLFNIAEIKELSFKINPAAQNFTVDEVVESFNHPLYFQFYYKQHKDDFTFNHIDHIVIYELLSAFIYNHIYIGRHSLEKVLLVEMVVDSMDSRKEVFYINKAVANNLIKQNSQAYLDLLNIGVLREVNESDGYQHKVYIEFGNHHFLAYSFATCLLNKNNNLFDKGLIQQLNNLFNAGAHKLAILKWCIMHAVKNGQWEHFDCLTETKLCANGKSELVVFLSDLLEKEVKPSKTTNPSKPNLNYKLNPTMFNYFFGLELMGPYFQQTLNTLLKFDLTIRKRILIYSALGVSAYIRLDLDELYNCISILNTFPKENYQFFIINPLNCLNTIYYYLKYGIVKKEALVQLTKLSFYFPEDVDNIKSNAANDMIYLLGLHTLLIGNNPKKTIRTINLFKAKYKGDKIERQTSNFNFFLQIIVADAYFKLGDLNKVSALYFVIASTYKNDMVLTPYMKSLFIALKIKTLLNTPDDKFIFNELKCMEVMVSGSGNNLTKLYMSGLLLTQEKYLSEHPQFHKQLYYDIIKMLRENGLNRDVFKFDINKDIPIMAPGMLKI